MHQLTIESGDNFDKLLTADGSSDKSRASLIRKAVIFYTFLRRAAESGSIVKVIELDGSETEVKFE